MRFVTRVDQQLSVIAQAVAHSIDQRQWDKHRLFNEALVERLFCYHLLNHIPECESRLWIGVRPWPEESNESIGYWVEAHRDQAALAMEVNVDDPRDESPRESAAVWGKIIADVMRLATAIAHRGLSAGYVILFGELRHDPGDERIRTFPLTAVGETKLIETAQLFSNSVMDAGFFEELKHPQEIVPAGIELRLVATQTGPGIGYWIWKISLPNLVVFADFQQPYGHRVIDFQVRRDRRGPRFRAVFCFAVMLTIKTAGHLPSRMIDCRFSR